MKQKIKIFDAFDFTVLCQLNMNELSTCESVVFTNGFFIDIDNVIVCTSDGLSYLYSLPDR